MKKIIFLLLALAAVASCRPWMLYFEKPPGTPEYQLGWQDGCDSGLAAEGSIIYKQMYGFKKRPELADDSMYKLGWNEGFTYCRFFLASQK